MEYIPLTHWHLCFWILNFVVFVTHLGLNHATTKTLRFSLITLFLCKAKLTGSSWEESWLSLVTRSYLFPDKGILAIQEGTFHSKLLTTFTVTGKDPRQMSPRQHTLISIDLPSGDIECVCATVFQPCSSWHFDFFQCLSIHSYISLNELYFSLVGS